MINNAFTISAIIPAFIILIAYFSNKRVKNLGNTLFSKMVIFSFVENVCAIFSYLTIKLNDYIPTVNNLVSKSLIVFMLLWATYFTLYFVAISSLFNNNTFKNNRAKGILYLYLLIVAIIVYYLPLEYYSSDLVAYSYGPSANVAFVIIGIYVVIWVYCIIRNAKNLKDKKYIPLYFMLVLGAVAVLAQKMNPAFLIISAVLSYATMLIYFTLENPDIEMLQEFKIAKDRAEKANEEKEMFLYNATQDLRTPLSNIRKACEYITTNTKEEETKEGLYYISNNTTNMFNTINNILDVTNMEITNIKVYNAKYNTKLVLQELYKIYSAKVPNDVKLRFNVDSNIPEMLYGDALRIKQLLTIILDNAFKYTDKGYVELNLNTIVKEDICRLIIKVEDSGKGIKASELDEVFNKDNQLYASLEKVDDSKKNLAIAKSISTLLGGILLLESEIGSGTKITFVLDQKIYDEKSNELEKLEIESSKYVDKAKIMVVSEDDAYLTNLVKKLSKYDVEIEQIDSGAKCLEKIRLNNKYDLIIMDEELTRLSALDILNKLKDIKGFDIDVAILTNNPDNISYIKDGFKHVLNRRLTSKEIDKLMEEIEK